MQETNLTTLAGTTPESTTVSSLLDLPIAKLQIVQASNVVKETWLDRSMLEPHLTKNADGLWVLSVRRQGEHT